MKDGKNQEKAAKYGILTALPKNTKNTEGYVPMGIIVH